MLTVKKIAENKRVQGIIHKVLSFTDGMLVATAKGKAHTTYGLMFQSATPIRDGLLSSPTLMLPAITRQISAGSTPVVLSMRD